MLMAAKKKSGGTLIKTIIIMLFVLPLAPLFVSLWTHDYKAQRKDAADQFGQVIPKGERDKRAHKPNAVQEPGTAQLWRNRGDLSAKFSFRGSGAFSRNKPA